MKYSYVYVFLFVFLFMSCIIDPGGYVLFTNGYKQEVRFYSIIEYNNTIFDGFSVLESGKFVDTRMGKFSRVVEIRIETMDGTVLAEYTPEYIASLRKTYGIKRNQQESLVFTEKGLFFDTKEIAGRYRRDLEKIIGYYRSDEAVRDLQAMMEAVE